MPAASAAPGTATGGGTVGSGSGSGIGSGIGAPVGPADGGLLTDPSDELAVDPAAAPPDAADPG